MRETECTLLVITGQGWCTCSRQGYVQYILFQLLAAEYIAFSSSKDLLICILKGTKYTVISEQK
jgi:hypothetical protein